MKYDIQKVIMKNATIYNFLYENTILGHLIETDDSKVLIQSSDVPLQPIAESFGFEGTMWLFEDEDYKLTNLTPTPEFKPNYDFKVINLSENFLIEEEISE
jgi:hypothetical protein